MGTIDKIKKAYAVTNGFTNWKEFTRLNPTMKIADVEALCYAIIKYKENHSKEHLKELQKESRGDEMMPKEYENPYHNSGHKTELIEIVAEIIHDKWRHDVGTDIQFWEDMTENEKDVNRQWAVKILDAIFRGEY